MDSRDALRHIPVLHTTVLKVLAPAPGETVLDVTLGLGGHAQAFLSAIGPTGLLIGLDADPRNLTLAAKLLDGKGPVKLIHANFRALDTLPLPPLDIVFADLGLSSPHVDDPTRGFTFRSEAPLDLRYDPENGRSASELIGVSTPDELFTIFSTFGEFPGSARLGRVLAGKSVATTTALKGIVEQVFGYRAPKLLPQVFQALRIAVNDELGALRCLLDAAPRLLSSRGRIGILSYHSLEDRLVKHAFRSLCTPEKNPETGKTVRPASFALLTPKPLTASSAEIADNPRARSVKFRAILRVS